MSSNISVFDTMKLVLGMGRGHRKIEVSGQHTDDGRITECEGFPYLYNLRGSDYDCGIPATVENGGVVCNFCGRFFTKDPLPFPEGQDWLPIRDYWWEGR